MQRFTPPQPRLKIPELFTQQIYGQVSAGTGMSCNYHALTNFVKCMNRVLVFPATTQFHYLKENIIILISSIKRTLYSYFGKGYRKK
jgi:hypothetical protein